MGRYSSQLAPALADLAGVSAGQAVLDVGAGPGALTAELVGRVGPDKATAVEPNEGFVAAARARLPGADIRIGFAEELPFPDATFDAALSQLVVHFMKDPLRGVREMARVTRPGGVVASCVWDLGGGRAPMSPFWRAAIDIDPSVMGEDWRMGTRRGQLVRLFEDAGLGDVREAELSVSTRHGSREEWWAPFTLRVGPVGDYLNTIDDERVEAIRRRAFELLPDGAFTLTSVAWAARGLRRITADRK